MIAGALTAGNKAVCKLKERTAGSGISACCSFFTSTMFYSFCNLLAFPHSIFKYLNKIISIRYAHGTADFLHGHIGAGK
jgi:hypothetical protein